MSGLNKSAVALTFTPESAEELSVCRYDDPLLEEPEFSWELQTQTCDPIGSPWAKDRPIGNARRSVVISVLVNRKNISTLVRYMRHVEMVANMNRAGSMLWQEGFHNSRATYETKWEALVMSCHARYASPEEIPTEAGGVWAVIAWEIQLTNPTEL